ncbi:hypothetical protein AAFF_G00036310 [Aldrovandia affinis]|uniref:Uncharacterized protein n=1 Tax=Aldrovandia affinis TaxID=143900 RepID=A0AAD7WFY1_9TELE|nr:hypothetical protein AAFF_G00036310 [Aldrovandia affinis]
MLPDLQGYKGAPGLISPAGLLRSRARGKPRIKASIFSTPAPVRRGARGDTLTATACSHNRLRCDCQVAEGCCAAFGAVCERELGNPSKGQCVCKKIVCTAVVAPCAAPTPPPTPTSASWRRPSAMRAEAPEGGAQGALCFPPRSRRPPQTDVRPERLWDRAPAQAAIAPLPPPTAIGPVFTRPSARCWERGGALLSLPCLSAKERSALPPTSSPLIIPASCAAQDTRHNRRLHGAVNLTRLPDRDPCLN